jgi:hypothetical protein
MIMSSNRPHHLRSPSGGGAESRSQTALNFTVDICHQLFQALRIVRVGAGTRTRTELSEEGIALYLTGI